MNISQETPQNTPKVLGVISEGEHQKLLESGMPEGVQRRLGMLGIEAGQNDLLVVQETDPVGVTSSTKIVGAQYGELLDDTARAQYGLGTPSDERNRLAEETTRKLRAHERGEDSFGFKSPYGGGSR